MFAATVLFLSALSSSATALVLPGVGLGALAKLRGKYIGTATEEYNIHNATDWGRTYGKIALSNEFSSYTNENMLKWESTEPEPGVFNFEPAEKLFALAKQTGKKMRGHTLVWHSQLPTWVQASNFTATELRAVLKRHVQTQASHFKGRVYAWDVLNEIFADDGSLRQTVFYTTLGESYIEDAFRWAHEADPKAKLYLNDYNFESITPKTDAAYALVKKLKAKGVPIHGVGAQAHLHVGSVPTDIKQTLQRFASLGVDVAITELDIRGLVPETAEKLEQQRKDFYIVTKTCIELKACVGVTLWGVSDWLSWIPHVFPEADFGLAWDDDLKKKPAYYGIQKALLGF